MPDLYDRATVATELRLRGEILAKVRKGREPPEPFEFPQNANTQPQSEVSETSPTSLDTSGNDSLSQVDIPDLYGEGGSRDVSVFV